MPEILFLAHRLPWPPNKGDKIRSYHWLRFLAERYRVHLGTFVDASEDWRYVRDLRPLCASACIRPLPRWWGRLRALRGLLGGAPLTLPWYRDRRLHAWSRSVLSERPVAAVLAFSSAMGPYLPEPAPDGAGARPRRGVDLEDVDSEKWRQYAQARHWPLSVLHRREARRLLAYERQLIRSADRALLISAEEQALLQRLAPETEDRLEVLGNGVDTDYFDPAQGGARPYAPGVVPLVFVGAMDYWPNIDAVCWFAESVLPRVREQCPRARLYIVGSRPGPTVNALERMGGVTVTGFVEDIRPWVGHAALAVAPLRVARGVQNKVLEAMALARPVVATPEALEGIRCLPGQEVLSAGADPEAFAALVVEALAADLTELGAAARQRVVADYGWACKQARLEEILGLSGRGEAVEPAPRVASAPRMEAAS